MLIKRFYDEKLAQASFLVGCQATGEALVIDPNRDVRQYIAAAQAEGVRITHVTETHIHADFVSGSRELAQRTGARLLLSDEGGAEWTYEFAESAGATLLHDRDSFEVGNLRIDALHTPGHTPEHLSFMVTDTPATAHAMGVFTGDFIFAGDVGRPDLLEKAAGVEGSMVEGARTLYRSLQRFKELPDYLQLWPGHGAGSACGKSLGAVPSTTLGYEKLANWGLADVSEEEFIAMVLAGQPEPPRYFAEMKRINREGPRILGAFTRPERFAASRLPSLLEEQAIVIDTRPWSEFANGHIPGTISIPLNKSFTTWAGWLVPYDSDFHLIVDDTTPDRLDEAVRDLAMIGLDRVGGHFGRDALEERAAGDGLETVPQMSADELAAELREGRVQVVDVRGAGEWEAGHLPGVPNIPLGELGDRLDEVQTDKPLVVQCQAGARSAIAASVLRAKGISNVVNLAGGFSAWRDRGHPVEQASPRHTRDSSLGGMR